MLCIYQIQANGKWLAIIKSQFAIEAPTELHPVETYPMPRQWVLEVCLGIDLISWSFQKECKMQRNAYLSCRLLKYHRDMVMTDILPCFKKSHIHVVLIMMPMCLLVAEIKPAFKNWSTHFLHISNTDYSSTYLSPPPLKLDEKIELGNICKERNSSKSSCRTEQWGDLHECVGVILKGHTFSALLHTLPLISCVNIQPQSHLHELLQIILPLSPFLASLLSIALSHRDLLLFMLGLKVKQTAPLLQKDTQCSLQNGSTSFIAVLTSALAALILCRDRTA